ncbi:MAG: DUF1501 domain-containing protein [Pseudomonadota bacterium]
MTQSRRSFLRTLALGCSAAASPLVTPVSFASGPGDNRLVVIILRGAMDGLDVVRPLGDGALKSLRPNMGNDSLALTDFWGAHPALDPLAPLWAAGELSFAHAVSTPYRNKRSHFDGQDFLENGGFKPDGTLTDARDGWLNRLVAELPGARADTAFAVGRGNLLLLSGQAPISAWSPEADLDLSPQAQLLLEKVYENDPLFHAAAMQAIQLSETTEGDMGAARRQGRTKALAEFAAGRLREETRIAAFSIGGWDTHARQANTLPRALDELTDAILALKSGLGPIWAKTAVLCLTEFGRTVRENGTGGTDHGTGGAAIFAGGALKGSSVLGTWPGLGPGDLFEDRDLMPTRDVRAYAAHALQALMPVDRTRIETKIFPGLDMGSDPGLIS